jgi:LPXTG-motif cell wall-anchored protein
MTINQRKQNKLVRSMWAISIAVTTGSVVLMSSSSAAIPSPFVQGVESSFGVLAGTSVTNTGPSQISGTAGSNMGVSTGSSIDGGISIGTGVLHSNDAAAIAAKSAMVVTNAILTGASDAVVATELGGLTLAPGVHSAASFLTLTGVLTLNAGGNADAIFIIKSPSTLVTAVSSSVVLTGSAQACNVYWQIGSSATLAVDSIFTGQLYAATSITAQTRAVIRGQLLAGTGAVTLDSNIIVNDSCGSDTTTPAPIVVPTPSYGGGYTAPAPVQSSSIASINSAVCSVTSGYVATLTGVFPTPVANIAINGNNIASDRWTQTATTVAVQIPPTDTKSFTIDVYNGLTPMLASQTFLCTEAVVVPIAVPTEVPVVTPTETGGELPKTSTNDYNNLFAGIAISFLGASGVLLRKRTQK